MSEFEKWLQHELAIRNNDLIRVDHREVLEKCWDHQQKRIDNLLEAVEVYAYTANKEVNTKPAKLALEKDKQLRGK